MMGNSQVYSIAGCVFNLEGRKLVDAVAQIPGFKPFAISETNVPCNFTVIDFPTPLGLKPQKLLYKLNLTDVTIQFYTVPYGYYLRVECPNEEPITLCSQQEQRIITLYGNYNQRLLAYALWVGFGLMTQSLGAIAFHASCIVHQNKAFLFLGESGTGKSTHTRLWLKNIVGSELLNDDSPIVRVEGDGIYVYGSPWSGKTPCFKPQKYALGGCVRLFQAKTNTIDRLPVFQAFAAVHPSCPPLFAYDKTLYGIECQTLSTMLEKVSVYRMGCLPNDDAAILSNRTLEQL